MKKEPQIGVRVGLPAFYVMVHFGPKDRYNFEEEA